MLGRRAVLMKKPGPEPGLSHWKDIGPSGGPVTLRLVHNTLEGIIALRCTLAAGSRSPLGSSMGRRRRIGAGLSKAGQASSLAPVRILARVCSQDSWGNGHWALPTSVSNPPVTHLPLIVDGLQHQSERCSPVFYLRFAGGRWVVCCRCGAQKSRATRGKRMRNEPETVDDLDAVFYAYDT
jgi:hypothetical protein